MRNRITNLLLYLLILMFVESPVSCKRDSAPHEYVSEKENECQTTQATVDEIEKTKEIIMSPEENLKVVGIANPTLYYNAEHYWTLTLIEKMIATGKYNSLFLDIPVVEAMMFDDYVKGTNNVSLKKLVDNYNYSVNNMLYLNTDDIIDLLAHVKEHNLATEKKVSIYGLWYGVGEMGVEIFTHVYKDLSGIGGYLIKNREAYTEEQIHAIGKELDNYLCDNERNIREKNGKKFDLFKRIAYMMQHEYSIGNIETSDTRMFENFLFAHSLESSDSKSIVFLGPYQTRLEKDRVSFRKLLVQKFPDSQFLFYNILDESYSKRRIAIPLSQFVVSEISAYHERIQRMKRQ
ncbi:MAG: hypothetical protein K5899_01580 [Bacteroidaceae bacterium]|nr:hypothetical protein [Bacteroidaceae bacterium]